MNQISWLTCLLLTFSTNPSWTSARQSTTEYIEMTAWWYSRVIINQSKIKYWLETFQQTVNMPAGNWHLQFTAEIWTNEAISPTPEKEDRVQIVTNDEFPFSDMKMSWSPEGDLQFGLFRKKRQQLKYVGKESTHTPGTLRAIPYGVLDLLAKLTSRNPSIHAEVLHKIYPAHANALRKAGLAAPVFPKMRYLWRKQD